MRPFGRVLVERRLHLAREGVVGRRRLVGPLDHGDRSRIVDERPEGRGGERTEARHGDRSDRSPLGAEVVDHRGRRVGHRPHRDQDVLGVLAAVRLDPAIAPAGELAPAGERIVDRRRQAVVEGALADPALHVAVLVLDDPGHQGLARLEPAPDGGPGVADELAEEIVLGQDERFEGVGRQEPVLGHDERHLALLGHPAGDGGEVGRLLGVAGEQDPPAGVGDTHHVVVAGVDVEGLAGQRPGTDVEHDRQALAGDDVEDLLHEDEALTGGEIRDPGSGQRSPFGRRRRRVLGLGLDEPQRRPPQVRRAVRDGCLEDRRHGRRRRDRVGAGDLGEPGLDRRDRLGPIDDRRFARECAGSRSHRTPVGDAHVRRAARR